jgi:hypothetical protein
MDREWEERAENGDGQFAIACALIAIARAIDRLGNGDAATNVGAIEGLGMHLGEKIDALSAAISSISET